MITPMPHVPSRSIWSSAAAAAAAGLFVITTAPLVAQQPAAPLAAAPAAAPAPQLLTIDGRVVDMRGDGVPVAKVWVTSWDAPLTVLARTVADGDGYFRVPKVPPLETLEVRATAEGFCSGLGYHSKSAPVTVQINHAATVRGTLVDRAGNPVANADVRARLTGRVECTTQSDARTDDQGRFLLPGVALGPQVVNAWVAGEGLAEQRLEVRGDTKLELRPGSETPTTMRVVVEGVPADALPSVTLALLPYTKGSLSYLPPPHDRPRFTTGEWKGDALPDRDYTVYPNAKGFAFAPRESRVKAKAGPHLLKFTASRIHSTAMGCPVIARDGDGKPVAGVTLVIRASNDSRDGRATTDAEGKATLPSPVAAGGDVIIYSVDDRWVADQTKPDGTYGSWDRRFLDDHEWQVDPSTTLELRLAPACSIGGRLLCADGRPAALVAVELQETRAGRSPSWMTMARTTTDREGRFQILRQHHLDDLVRVFSSSSCGEWTSEPLEMSKPGSVLQLPEGKLSEPAAIEGVVRDAQQQPVGGQRVWLRDWDMALKRQRSGSVIEVMTDRDGRYRFLGVELGGAYLQLVQGEETFPRTNAIAPFEVEAGKTYTFDL